MTRPLVLELFAGAQGTAVGWARAGFRVVATDRTLHPKHPEVDEFFVADSMEVLKDHAFLRQFSVVAGGPPCQGYTECQPIQGRDHPMLIPDMRRECQQAGVQYVIENVPGARWAMINPIELCGCMFPGLRTYRPRLFESSIPLSQPPHAEHVAKVTKMGRPPVPGEFMHVVGNFSGAQAGRDAMGIDWKMSRDDLREAIPPRYATWVGKRLLESGAIRGA